MSISAINGASQAHPQAAQAKATTPSPRVTPFSQQLDAQGTHGHHHHRGASNSATSPTTAASAAGTTPSGSVASAVLKLLS